VRERLRTSCTKDLIGRIWSESFPGSKEGDVVVEMVEVEVAKIDTDGCGRIDDEIEDDDCSLPKARGCF
jgi:hypothetical protein